MFRTRLLALAAALAALAVGQLGLPRAASAQDVYVVPAPGVYVSDGASGAQPRYAGLAPFIEALSPYGTWVDLPSVGLAWKPADSRVGATFVPYLTNGHWADSDVGWVFESDFEWGYATFHYGRWLFDGQWGWVWTPDTEWGASWVDWRVADGYVGWAPLPPLGYAYSAGYGPSYTFVSVTYLTYVDLPTYVLPAPATVYWTERSAPCTTVWSGAGRSWPAGPRVSVPPRGLVSVNPPTRGVVQVRPPALGAVGGGRASADRVSVRAGGFVEGGVGVRVGVSGPRSAPNVPAWGTTPPPPPAPPAARRGFGVQRAVLPPSYGAPPAQPQRPAFAAPPPTFAQPAQPLQPQRPAFTAPPSRFAPPVPPVPPQRPAFAQPAQPQRPALAAPPPTFARPAPPVQPQRPALAAPPPTFARPAPPVQPQRPALAAPPPTFAQPAPPQRPAFAQPVAPQRPAFVQPPRQPFVQQQPVFQPPPPAPVVARPPPQVVVPPSAVRGGGQLRSR